MRVSLTKCLNYFPAISLDALKIIIMPLGKSKEEDLKHLKSFVSTPNLRGHTTHIWYRGLRTYYPWQFIQLTKVYKSDGAGRLLWIEEAKRSLNRSWEILSNYFINPPIDQSQKDEYDRIVILLEDLLLKMNKEN